MQTVANVYLFHQVAMLGKATVAHTQGNSLTNQICTVFHTCHFSFSHRWREQAWEEIKEACITPQISTDVKTSTFLYTSDVLPIEEERQQKGHGYKMNIFMQLFALLEKNEMKFHHQFFFFFFLWNDTDIELCNIFWAAVLLFLSFHGQISTRGAK